MLDNRLLLVLTIAIRKQKRVESSLCSMPLICISFSSLQLKWDNEVLQFIFVLAGDLHCGIDIAFEAIHWRPNMLFDLEQLGYTQIELCTIAIFNKGICLAGSSE